MRRSRNVKWVDPNTRPKTALLPHPHVAQVLVSPPMSAWYEAHLHVGALWKLDLDLHVDHRYDGTAQPHEFRYLVPGYGFWAALDGAFAKGTLAVYTGEHRVTEMDRAGTLLRVPRPSFLIGHTRYITTNLMDFVPATSHL